MPSEHLHNPHAGEILSEEFLKPLSLSQNSVAKAIHVPPNRIHAIVKGERAVTADTDLRLCHFLGLTEGFFLRLQAAYETAEARRTLNRVLSSITPYQAVAGQAALAH
jgi:addiction module HigA family antidote